MCEYPSREDRHYLHFCKTYLASVNKEQRYYFELERILLYNLQVISLLVHFQMNVC